MILWIEKAASASTFKSRQLTIRRSIVGETANGLWSSDGSMCLKRTASLAVD